MAIATQEQNVVDNVPKGLYIGGEWRETSETIEVEDPSTGEVLAEVADATVDDALSALGAAADAQAGWAATQPRERGRVLADAYALIMERVDELALIMTLEM